MAQQDKITFQPKNGFREALERVAARDDRSISYVINRYIGAGLAADGEPVADQDEAPKS